MVAVLDQEWPGSEYNIFNNNCQTFCIEFCRRLGVQKIPDEIVRFAKWK